MLIVGEWWLCDDGVTRPAIRAKVQDANAAFLAEIFLVDGCADRTVFSADLLGKLHFVPAASPAGLALHGIGGKSGFVVVNTAIELTKDDGGMAHVRGDFAAFTDPVLPT